MSLLEIAGVLRARFGGSYPFPRLRVPKAVVWLAGPLMGPVTRRFISRNVGYPVRFDNARSQTLGVRYRSVEDTFSEHFQQALDDGLLSRR
jgi:hypothetical protein